MISHLAGDQIEFDGVQRQRCSWCGFVLIDRMPERISVAVDPDDPNPDTSLPWWPVGAWVRSDGDQSMSMATVVDPIPSEKHPGQYRAPDDACLRMPPESTL